MPGLSFLTPLPFNKIPAALMSESEKDLEYYKKSITAIISKWWNSSMLYNTTSTNQFYFKHYQYYFGSQDNGVYRYLTQAGPDLDLPAVYIPGQQIKQYIDYMVGTIIKEIDAFNITAKSLNPEMQKELSVQFERAMAELELRPLMNQIEQATGIPMNPIAGFKPERPEDIDQLRKDTMLVAEKCAKILAQNDFQINMGEEVLCRVFFDALMVGRGTIYQSVVNNKTKWEYIPAPFVIQDLAPFSDINKGASYGGHVLLMSIQEIIETYDLTEQQITRLQEINMSEQLMTSINQSWGGMYWWWDIYSATPKAMVVHAEWKDIEYDKKITSKDVKGNSYFESWNNYQSMSKAEKSDFHSSRSSKRVYAKPKTVIRKGVCIAGEIYIECGIKPNQVGYQHSGENELGYRNFTPMQMFGQNVSICQRLEPLQNERDI